MAPATDNTSAEQLSQVYAPNHVVVANQFDHLRRNGSQLRLSHIKMIHKAFQCCERI